MLRLPDVGVVSPESVDAVLEALAAPGARLIAGGTDVVPQLKHHRERPDRLVSLHRVGELRGVREDAGAEALRIGASTTLAEVAEHASVAARAPSLAEAAATVASPPIRNTATIGGNLCLDVRCRWVNQPAFWRKSLGGCLKCEGTVCHVVEKGQRCVAAVSSDCTPVLIALEGRVHLRSLRGERVIDLADFHKADGVHHLDLAQDELLTEVVVPWPTGPRRTSYVKWRVRGSVDFPLISVALRFDMESDAPSANVTGARVVVGALGARPRVVRGLEAVHGAPLTESAAQTVADLVHAQCKPLENIPFDAAHRRHLSRVLTRRAVEGLVRA